MPNDVLKQLSDVIVREVAAAVDTALTKATREIADLQERAEKAVARANELADRTGALGALAKDFEKSAAAGALVDRASEIVVVHYDNFRAGALTSYVELNIGGRHVMRNFDTRNMHDGDYTILTFIVPKQKSTRSE